MHLVWNVANPGSVPENRGAWLAGCACAVERARDRLAIANTTGWRLRFIVVSLRSHSISNVACNPQGRSIRAIYDVRTTRGSLCLHCRNASLQKLARILDRESGA